MAKRDESEYVCKRCWLPLTYTHGSWRHICNQYMGKTCGRKPEPQKREEFEAELRAIVDGVVHRPPASIN